MGRNREVSVEGRRATVSVADSSNEPEPLIPAVFCPFPPRISPHVADVQRYAVAWATRHHFLDEPGASARFAGARFAHLMARAYPDASHADLCLASAWLTFTFALDDHLESALGSEPGQQREIAALLVAYLRAGSGLDGLAARLGRPLAGALADIWGRTRARTSPYWRARFIGHVGAYAAANGWEAANRAVRRTPTVAEYIQMRRHTAATAMFFDLIEVFAGVELDPPAAAHPALVGLRRRADNVVAWFNDLVSWRKELAVGDPHNLVLVVGDQMGCGLTRAVSTVASWHDAEVRAFRTTGSRLDAGLLAKPGVTALVDGLAHWLRANVDWSAESGRYAPAEQPIPQTI